MSRDDVSDSPALLILLTIDVALSVWFWTAGVQVGESSSTNCQQVGFLSAKFDLTTPWFKTVNLVCLGFFFVAALCLGWRRAGINLEHKRNVDKNIPLE